MFQVSHCPYNTNKLKLKRGTANPYSQIPMARKSKRLTRKVETKRKTNPKIREQQLADFLQKPRRELHISSFYKQANQLTIKLKNIQTTKIFH